MQHHPYQHLHADNRVTIHNMSKAQCTQKQIAQAIGCSQSTVSKELKRNRSPRGYRPKQAQFKAQMRQRNKRHRPKVIQGDLRIKVIEKLTQLYSPEQICGALRCEGYSGPSVSSVYNFINEDKQNGGSLHRYLRINGKRRYRHRNRTQRHKLPARIGIENRPEIVARRERFGDWEADLIAGGKRSGYVLSLYERKSHFGRLVKLNDKDATRTAKAIIKALKGYRVWTVTYDNGLEFAKHALVNKILGSKSFFCRPYHSWEKGGVENFNGLVRQYLPKQSSFSNLGEVSLAQIEADLNSRPRKTLNFQPPNSFLNTVLVHPRPLA